MDGQVFPFRLLDPLFHFQRDILLTVLNKCIYIHNPCDEAGPSSPTLDSTSASSSTASTLSLPAKATASNVSFQFLSSIHDILLMDLENACYLENTFQMVTLDKVIFILQSDHWNRKKTWFNWIQYLIHMDRLDVYGKLRWGRRDDTFSFGHILILYV